MQLVENPPENRCLERAYMCILGASWCRAEGPDCVLLTEGVGDDKERRRPPAEARAPDLPQGLVVRVAGMSDLKAADEPALGDPLAAGGDDLCPWNRRKGGE